MQEIETGFTKGKLEEIIHERTALFPINNPPMGYKPILRCERECKPIFLFGTFVQYSGLVSRLIMPLICRKGSSPGT